MKRAVITVGWLGLRMIALLSGETVVGGERVQAQVLPDGTLPTTVNTPNNLDFTINGGTRSGNNLFHSFSQFSVPTGGSALFNNATDIQTIFARVTGGSASNIDGLLKANGAASLFLINPSGILFGANAQLNIGGSFIGTTANSIQFADGTEFSAVNPSNSPLLTISVPIGLQMGQNPGSITVQGQGNDGIMPTTNLGLLGRPGTTIALLGGNVTLNGGVITAPSGRIEIGAVNSGSVSLTATPTGWQFGYAQAQTLGNVALTNRSSLWNPDSTGNPSGGIQVVGQDIQLDQSQIAATTTGNEQGSSISVNAQGTLQLSGVNAKAQAPSAWIVNQVAPGAIGQGGDVNVQAGTVLLRDGSAIETMTLGAGAAGKVQVTADTIDARNAVTLQSPFAPFGTSSSRIASSTYTSGAGGQITVRARQLTLADGGVIESMVFPGATGQGGTIDVNVADEIDAIGASPISFAASGINSYTYGSGNSGNINVSTGTLNLTEGGTIFTFVVRMVNMPDTGTGNAGNVTVDARQSMNMSGFASFLPVLITFVGTSTTGSGSTGDVSVTTPNLTLDSGAFLGTSTIPVIGPFGDPEQSNNLGNSGNVNLNVAERLIVRGINQATLDTTSLGAATYGNGKSGDVKIQTNQLQVLDGATVYNIATATGNAGTLTIQAKDILVDGQNGENGSSSSINANAPILDPVTREFYHLPDVPTGSIDLLNIKTQQLTIRNGGVISVTHEGTGNAGRLDIQADQISLDSGKVTATTTSGQGGNINLAVKEALLLRHESKIDAEASNNGNGGNIAIAAPIIIGLENSDIIANAFNGNGGNINIKTQGLFGLQFRNQLTPENDITASSQLGVNGTVEINNFGVDPNSGLVELPATIIDPSQKIAKGCDVNSGSRFVITGRGGVPQNPVQEVKRDLTWNDLRDLSAFHKASLIQPPPASTFVEATDWYHNPQNGKVELLATQPSHPTPSATCASASHPRGINL